jgi:hypothetical protein
MNEITILNNRERTENTLFLAEAWKSLGRPRSYSPLEDSGALEPSFALFKDVCFHILATQPAPPAVYEADWRRLMSADTIEEVYDDSFEIKRYAMDPPVWRQDSKGKVIDFIRVATAIPTLERLLPEPSDPDVTADVLHAVSGGALKSHAFAVVSDMLRAGRWTDPDLYRFSYTIDARLRKRTVRMGLTDLPEKADTFADMKAFNRAVHAIVRLSTDDDPQYQHSDLFTHTVPIIRCEICDAARMASCPLPHCRWRREHIEP